jgi:hypothetical protein
MSPMDPRLNTLRTRALMWDRSLDWVEEPDEISLEIIPPTHWPEASDCAAAGSAASATLALACGAPDAGTRPVADGRTSGRRRDAATECRALAILAAALVHAVQSR